ncbi:PaaI family thioesterase [Paramagnetospirillum kuznetsovii]|uniref:PaaI family thioesterase n=1 Tax=Paramagnetospirillum kuznetsovii TaxID=2053833 RepID=A0A364NWZ2_9PROT|nr:PaaI family thioesterase [Paramagnetospirillum kuznetsovii]RAU21582.1 PaaI family thioesterase [Paramagnetospirillum kuznetsovii]
MTQDLLDGEPTSGFQDLLGYHLAEWAEGHAVLELAVERKHCNRAGVVHGGVLATLIDTSCGFSATYCPVPGRVRRVVTLSLTSSFLGQARHGIIRAVGRMRAGGSRIVFCSAEVLDEDGKLIAMGEGSFRYRTGSKALEGVPL